MDSKLLKARGYRRACKATSDGWLLACYALRFALLKQDGVSNKAFECLTEQKSKGENEKALRYRAFICGQRCVVIAQKVKPYEQGGLSHPKLWMKQDFTFYDEMLKKAEGSAGTRLREFFWCSNMEELQEKVKCWRQVVKESNRSDWFATYFGMLQGMCSKQPWNVEKAVDRYAIAYLTGRTFKKMVLGSGRCGQNLESWGSKIPILEGDGNGVSGIDKETHEIRQDTQNHMNERNVYGAPPRLVKARKELKRLFTEWLNRSDLQLYRLLKK